MSETHMSEKELKEAMEKIKKKHEDAQKHFNELDAKKWVREIVKQLNIPYQEDTLKLPIILGIDAHVWNKAVNRLVEALIQLRLEYLQLAMEYQKLLERC